eukprot:7424609-Prorocentrum_lima.AAC.1
MGFLSTKVHAMSLKSVLIKIGNSQGIQMLMYNRMFRWSGTNDIVDYAGTHFGHTWNDRQASADIQGLG